MVSGAHRIYPLQIVVFRGLPTSLPSAVEGAFRKSPTNLFVCILEPGQSAQPVSHTWQASVQPLHPTSNLFILRAEGDQEAANLACQFVELASEKYRGVDVDVLYLSDVANPNESKKLIKWLKGLQDRIETVCPNSTLRRI